MAIRSHTALTASTAATVTLTGIGEMVEVLAHGLGPVYFTIDGSSPTVKGDDMHVCQAGGAVQVKTSDRDNTVVVKLISASAQDVSVGLIG